MGLLQRREIDFCLVANTITPDRAQVNFFNALLQKSKPVRIGLRFFRYRFKKNLFQVLIKYIVKFDKNVN